MFADEEMVLISALQHYLFCPRQCALIHVEGVWSENYLTASGRRLHERVDCGRFETRRDIHVATSVRLSSRGLGLMGVADVVEFRRVESAVDMHGSRLASPLPRRDGLWQPFPVEYKRGEPKAHRADEVQLCAQALCLEEMLGVVIPEGALFYGEIRRRQGVAFDCELRRMTAQTVGAVRSLLERGVTPPPVHSDGCAACSLHEVCRPDRISVGANTNAWIDRVIRYELEGVR